MPKLIKTAWQGRLISIQPRIRLTRSFDQRYHTYSGYVLCIDGELDDTEGIFQIAIGKKAQEKFQFQIGDEVAGASVPVAEDRLEIAGYYKTSGLKLLASNPLQNPTAPPFVGIPPTIEVYRERGHRRLDSRTYKSKCLQCIWGCKMAVEMIIDHWNPSVKRYRVETFCYGPKSCSFYRAGKPRKVPGRKGMVYTEEDWLDEETTSHRGEDE